MTTFETLEAALEPIENQEESNLDALVEGTEEPSEDENEAAGEEEEEAQEGDEQE